MDSLSPALLILQGEKDLPKRLRGPSFLEEYIPIEKELSVLVAQSLKGERRVYPVGEMVFEEKATFVALSLPQPVFPGMLKSASRR